MIGIKITVVIRLYTSFSFSEIKKLLNVIIKYVIIKDIINDIFIQLIDLLDKLFSIFDELFIIFVNFFIPHFIAMKTNDISNNTKSKRKEIIKSIVRDNLFWNFLYILKS